MVEYFIFTWDTLRNRKRKHHCFKYKENLSEKYFEMNFYWDPLVISYIPGLILYYYWSFALRCCQWTLSYIVQ